MTSVHRFRLPLLGACLLGVDFSKIDSPETADEYFPYYRKRHAFWRLYGLDLPDEMLRKIYYKNALRILPGVDKSLFPAS